jgi:hypothetical protein
MLGKNQYESTNLTIGYVLCYMVHLRELIQSSSLPIRQYKALLEDLHDLEYVVLNDRSGNTESLLIISRIWKAYPLLSYYSR